MIFNLLIVLNSVIYVDLISVLNEDQLIQLSGGIENYKAEVQKLRTITEKAIAEFRAKNE